MLPKVIQWLFVLLGIIALSFFFLPFNIWNWIASAGLILIHTAYFWRAINHNLNYPRRQKIEFSIYAILLLAMLVILAFQGIPLFAWIFFLGSIINLVSRVIR